MRVALHFSTSASQGNATVSGSVFLQSIFSCLPKAGRGCAQSARRPHVLRTFLIDDTLSQPSSTHLIGATLLGFPAQPTPRSQHRHHRTESPAATPFERAARRDPLVSPRNPSQILTLRAQEIATRPQVRPDSDAEKPRRDNHEAGEVRRHNAARYESYEKTPDPFRGNHEPDHLQ